MDRSTIVTNLSPLARAAFADDKLEISDDLSAANVNGWTSLSFMKLLEAIETEFGFKFKLMELINIKDMGDLISSIESHCK